MCPPTAPRLPLVPLLACLTYPHKARQFLMQKLLHLPLAEFEPVTLLTRVLVEGGDHHSQSLFQWTGHLESGDTKEHHRGSWGLKSSLQGLLLLHQAYPLGMARQCLHPALEVCSLRSRVHTATSHCTQMLNLSCGLEPPKAGPRILGTHLFGEASLRVYGRQRGGWEEAAGCLEAQFDSCLCQECRA